MIYDGIWDGKKMSVHKTRIMYIEDKSEGLSGSARVGRVRLSKSGRTLRYGGKEFRSLNGAGFKSNFYDVETGDRFWISSPRKDGLDRLYNERVPVFIDEDVREEYWTDIRQQPEKKDRTTTQR